MVCPGSCIKSRQEFHFRTLSLSLSLVLFLLYHSRLQVGPGDGWGMPWDVGDGVERPRGEAGKGRKGTSEEGMTK